MTIKPRKSTRPKSDNTPEQHALFEAHMRTVTAGTKAFKLDPVLEGQLKALSCAFNVTKSRHYGPLLHIGPPDCFWTQPERLMLTVRAFYPLADFALSDAEGCTSIALSGKNAATLSRLTKRGRK